MKRALGYLAALAAIAAVLFFLLFPLLSDQAAQRAARQQISDYLSWADALSAEETEERLAKAEAYHAAPADRGREEYSGIAGPSQVMGALELPKIGAALPIYAGGIEGQARLLTHQTGTALPVGETGGHAVLTGPDGVPADGLAGRLGLLSARMLRDAERLAVGDLMIVRMLKDTRVYRVESVQVISQAAEAAPLKADAEEKTLTLLVHGERQRLRLQGRMIPIRDAAADLAAADGAEVAPAWQSALVLGLPVFLAGAVILLIAEAFRGRRYRLPDGNKKG